MNQLNGKSAIVSGAGTGIGKGIALALAAEGVKVLLFGRRKNKLISPISQEEFDDLPIYRQTT